MGFLHFVGLPGTKSTYQPLGPFGPSFEDVTNRVRSVHRSRSNRPRQAHAPHLRDGLPEAVADEVRVHGDHRPGVAEQEHLGGSRRGSLRSEVPRRCSWGGSWHRYQERSDAKNRNKSLIFSSNRVMLQMEPWSCDQSCERVHSTAVVAPWRVGAAESSASAQSVPVVDEMVLEFKCTPTSW